MPVHVVCPNCDTMLALGEAAPARLTCPRCLAAFDNPAAPSAGQAAPLPALPVTSPIDHQFARDSTAGMWAVIITVGAIGIGIAAIGFSTGNAGIGVMVLMAAMALCIVIAISAEGARAVPAASAVSKSSTSAIDLRHTDATLDYSRPAPPPFRRTPLGLALRILLGIVAAVTILIVVGVLILLSICAIAMRA